MILLCLSGGKDSCYLALILRKVFDVVAFTLDNGHIPQVAWDNMKIVTKGMEHIIKKVEVENPVNCTFPLVVDEAIKEAKARGIKTIAFGITKYQGENPTDKDGISFMYPFLKEYDLEKIETELQALGVETDPTKTNSEYMLKEIAKDKNHRVRKEYKAMLDDGVISQDKYNEYEKCLNTYA